MINLYRCPADRCSLLSKMQADFISNLPKNEQYKPEWQIALHCLIEAAEGREFLMYARIRVLRALDLNAQSTHREGALPGPRLIFR